MTILTINLLNISRLRKRIGDHNIIEVIYITISSMFGALANSAELNSNTQQYIREFLKNFREKLDELILLCIDDPTDRTPRYPIKNREIRVGCHCKPVVYYYIYTVRSLSKLCPSHNLMVIESHSRSYLGSIKFWSSSAGHKELVASLMDLIQSAIQNIREALSLGPASGSRDLRIASLTIEIIDDIDNGRLIREIVHLGEV